MADRLDTDPEDFVHTRSLDGVLTIRLGHPANGNRISPAMANRLATVLAAAYADDTKLAVICSDGADFCRGIEGGAGQTEAPLPLHLQLEIILNLIQRAPFFSVACLHGEADDFGADLALACDWRIAAPGSSLCFTRHRQPGLVSSARRLADIIGGFRAFDALVRRSSIDAESAQAMGLISDCMNQLQFEDHLRELAELLAPIARDSIAILREAIGATDGSADVERLVRSSAAGAARP